MEVVHQGRDFPKGKKVHCAQGSCGEKRLRRLERIAVKEAWNPGWEEPGGNSTCPLILDINIQRELGCGSGSSRANRRGYLFLES